MARFGLIRSNTLRLRRRRFSVRAENGYEWLDETADEREDEEEAEDEEEMAASLENQETDGIVARTRDRISLETDDLLVELWNRFSTATSIWCSNTPS